jgi:hypothetical protein
MQRIFILGENAGMNPIHEFIGSKGFIVSVTPNKVATATSSRASGRWLVVADNGDKLTL